MRKHRIIYWAHFGIALIAHVCAIILPISLISAVFVYDVPWHIRVFMFAVSFFLSVLSANHLTNPHSLCVLTTLENHYRKKEGSYPVGDFMPRFYKHIRSMFKKGSTK